LEIINKETTTNKNIPNITVADSNKYIVELGFAVLIIYPRERNIDLTLFVNYDVFYMDKKMSLLTISTYVFIGNIIGAVFPSYSIEIKTKQLSDDIDTEVYKSNKILEYLKNYFNENEDKDFENLINKLNNKFGNA